MPRVKRAIAVQLMEELGFSSAGALSTARLQKKINLLHKVVDFNHTVEDERLNKGDNYAQHLHCESAKSRSTQGPCQLTCPWGNICNQRRPEIRRFEHPGDDND